MKKTCLWLAATSTLAFASAASAQEPAAYEASDTGDIVVTANRREQSLQDVPISIAVLDKAALANSGVVNSTQIQVTTPGVNIATGVGAPIIFVRGMGTANLVAEGAVGLYLDGVYLPYSAAIDNSFLDIERVEVLKGPQGTLYGRNTTAGAINFVTRDPAEKETVEVTARAGSWGTVQGQGYISTGPGRVSASVAAQYTHHNAYLKNLVPNRPDYNDRNEYGVRGRLKVELSDLWTASLSADYTEANDYGSIGFVSIYPRNYAANPATPGNFVLLKDDARHTYADFPSNGHRVENYGGSLTVRGDLGFADVVSISGYRNVYQQTAPDSDATDLPLTTFNSQNRFKNWSQELQLISAPSSKIEWIVGLYAFDLDATFGPTGAFSLGNTGGPLISEANIIVNGHVGTKSYAAYGQVTVPLFDAFKLTGGLRYSTERPELVEQNVALPNGTIIVRDTPAKERFNSLDPKVGIQYEANGQMLYASYTKGFRSGSYNLGSPGTPGPVRPEKVDAFEVGGKHTVARGVFFNWAGWYYKYKDLQVSRVLQSGGSLFTNQNAASATSKGVEASLTINSIDNLSLNLAASYIDAEYEDFTGAAAFVPAPSGYGLVRAERDVSGVDLPRAPSFTLSAQATYKVPIGDGSLDLSGNVYYTSSYCLDTPSDIKQDGYELINLSATYNLPGDRWAIGVFATNLTNSIYINYYNANAYGFGAIPSDPRIIGGMISFKY